MRKIITMTAAGILIAATLPAQASSNNGLCGSWSAGQQLSIQDITAKVTKMGYDVRKVEHEDGCYEVYAMDKNGARLEIYMHPVTGQIVKTKRKS